MTAPLTRLVRATGGTPAVKRAFLDRVREGNLTRDEHPTTHLCVYFPAYDPDTRSVFIGHHKKSGLWLFNGGHMDAGETPAESVVREAREEWGLRLLVDTLPAPGLLTVTEIEHPERQVCQWHFDLWFFFRFQRDTFFPDARLLHAEFSEFGWKPYREAARLFTDSNSKEALRTIRKLV